jgi:hypothetical protein
MIFFCSFRKILGCDLKLGYYRFLPNPSKQIIFSLYSLSYQNTPLKKHSYMSIGGRAIAEAVSRWLPSAATRVRARVWQVGFMMDKVASGQVFSEYFDSPCQNRSFHQLLDQHNHPGQLAEALRRADHPSEESYRLS